MCPDCPDGVINLPSGFQHAVGDDGDQTAQRANDNRAKWRENGATSRYRNQTTDKTCKRLLWQIVAVLEIP
jgi:hypothetical protein